MPRLRKFFVVTDNGVIDVMAYDGYDARAQVMRMTYGRARIISIERAA